jgi:predicted deacetylase
MFTVNGVKKFNLQIKWNCKMQLTSIQKVQCLLELLITKATIEHPTQSNPTQITWQSIELVT